MTRALQLAVLGSALLVILSVQVLPELDLPDTSLHRGTAPFLTKSRVTPTPAVLNATFPVWSGDTRDLSKTLHEQSLLHTVPLSNFLLTLLCSLRC